MTKTLIGSYKDSDGPYAVIVEMRLEPAQLADRGQTIEHKPIPAGATELSLNGEVWPANRQGVPDRRLREGVAYGQVVEDLRRVSTPRAQRLADIWERWHLNGMRANCVHMPDQKYTPGLKCPSTGYVSGTAWLYEPLPDRVVAELKELLTAGSEAAR